MSSTACAGACWAAWSEVAASGARGSAPLDAEQRRRQGRRAGRLVPVHVLDAGTGHVDRAVRAFGNAAEYIPAGICGLILLAFVGAPPLLIHGVGGVLFAGRIIHALGLLFQKGPSLGRVTGMVLTWLALLVAAVSLIAWSVI